MQLINGDCLEVMKGMDDSVIDLTVTSPPYDNLRTYNDSLVWNEDVWQNVIKQLFRLTKEGGVVVWVVGDATIKGSETGTSFKQALYFKEVGFNLHDTMIWSKKNPIPQNHNRYEQKFEYMFVLSKGKPNTFNPLKMETIGAVKEYKWDNANDYGPASAKRSRCETSKIKNNKNLFNIWEISVSSGKYTNSAPFPEDLVNNHIISWSNKNDVVLDPFLGSGTTGVACKELDREFIGIEKDPNYFKIAQDRINQPIERLLF